MSFSSKLSFIGFNLILSITNILVTVNAATPAAPSADDLAFDAQQLQRQQEQTQAVQRQQINHPDVRFQTDIETSQERPLLIPEAQCLTISELYLTDLDLTQTDMTAYASKGVRPPRSQFDWALDAVYQARDFSLPHCVGGEGIGILIKRIQNAIIAKGFVTTRVLVQPQDLRSGKLILTVIPGKVGQIQLRDNSDSPKATLATVWFALPTKSGALLNIRDIEQGLENLKRPPHADANIQIVPAQGDGAQPGESDLQLDFQQRFPYRLSLSLDDSGSKVTGRLQGTATVSIENMLSLNDLFYASLTHSFKRGSDDDGARGSKNTSLYYGVPWKNWLLSLSGSQYDYHQTVFGPFTNYEYAGKSTNLNANLARTLYRDGSRKTSATVGVWHRRTANFFDRSEIDSQRRRMAGWQIGLNHREYLGSATLDFSFNYKRGTGANRSLSAPEEAYGEGTSRPKMINAEVSFKQPFKLGEQPWQWSTSWRGQWNKTPLVPQDRLSIGGRYTVRGFDGELTLSGDRGWLWRNELAWNVMASGHELYLAIDKGVVRGRSTAKLLGRHLVGGAVGLRGNLWGLDYAYFIGTPIHKPQGFRTSHVTTGFSLSYQF
ncbi:Hemolysin activation/secretion protein [Pasteurella testudinis DSM 23072]|uniref:Hemolysin activation/secretion protein n=1 Tax=Pasteurella testudinis DSM 23072 TaxID=1122938 RepID=A0A1W1UG70_9PAST|nr:ShlB/FhaC/HecB family hemolysin secretion/activation protein [Pasteurella testudinis]SMB80022.1 Hemolysin activation/secretion protein [Pasteurella testudinis DSM 23072]SUB50618.1 ShlB family hemolysin secretion/activation protein [Pasteurella testudinis]